MQPLTEERDDERRKTATLVPPVKVRPWILFSSSFFFLFIPSLSFYPVFQLYSCIVCGKKKRKKKKKREREGKKETAFAATRSCSLRSNTKRRSRDNCNTRKIFFKYTIVIFIIPIIGRLGQYTIVSFQHCLERLLIVPDLVARQIDLDFEKSRFARDGNRQIRGTKIFALLRRGRDRKNWTKRGKGETERGWRKRWT